MQIGVLAIQGGFSKHKSSLRDLNINPIEVKYEKQLEFCDALIIPGGESTTISLLLAKYKLITPILRFSRENNLFGVCAGSILMSKSSHDARVHNLKCIDVTTKRNAWGRQIDSFADYITFKEDLCFNNKHKVSFIRAPKFYDIGKSCTVLAKYNSEPVLIRNNLHLISSFHPEMGNKLIVYEYFLNMINEK